MSAAQKIIPCLPNADEMHGKVLTAIFEGPDAKKSLAALNAMLTMKKLVVADLERAFADA